MPKVIVYVRADDARAIATATGKTIEEWTRRTLAEAIESFKEGEVARRESAES